MKALRCPHSILPGSCRWMALCQHHLPLQCREVLSCNRVNWAKISPQNCNTVQGKSEAASNSGGKGWMTLLWITCKAPPSGRQPSKGKTHDSCHCSKIISLAWNSDKICPFWNLLPPCCTQTTKGRERTDVSKMQSGAYEKFLITAIICLPEEN